MISLGEYKSYTLTVCQSNVEPDKVTYHLYQGGEDKGFCREDCIIDVFGPSVNDHLYVEAARRYDNLNRPDVKEFSSDFDVSNS